MKKTLFFAALVAVLGLASCSKPAESQETVYTIDQLYEQAESLVGDTITFQGMCTHLCAHGGRKAFLMGSDESRILRVEGGEMGNFDAACISNVVRVKGVLNVVEYQPEPVIVDDPAEQHGENGQGCETEQKAIKDYYVTAMSYTIVTE